MQKPASLSGTRCIVLGIIIGCVVMAVIVGVVGSFVAIGASIESESPKEQVVKHDKHSFDRQPSTQEPTLPEEPISGIVTSIWDGNTVYIDGTRYYFALVYAPNDINPDGMAAKQSVMKMCPVGSIALVEVTKQWEYWDEKRAIGIVYCDTDGYKDSMSYRLVQAGHVERMSRSQCDSLEAATPEWAVENDEYFYHDACGGKNTT